MNEPAPRPNDVSAAVMRTEQHALLTHQMLEIKLDLIFTELHRLEELIMATVTKAEFDALLAQIPDALSNLTSFVQAALNKAAAGEDYSAEAASANQILAGIHAIGNLGADTAGAEQTTAPGINSSPATPGALNSTTLPVGDSSDAPTISSTASTSSTSSTDVAATGSSTASSDLVASSSAASTGSTGV